MYYQPWAQRSLRGWLTIPFTEDGKQVARNNHPEVMRIGHQFMRCEAATLHGLHARRPSILLRDINPDHFGITDEGALLFVDFGTAKLCTDSSVRKSYAATEKYMAPEVGKRYSRPADVFSLGGIFSEILCWMSRTVALKLLERRQPSDGHFRILFDLIIKMLSENPHDRPLAGQVHNILRTLRSDYMCCNEVLPDEESDDGRSSSPVEKMGSDFECCFTDDSM
ncbi:kinase-like domain-containing protein [Blyttiomyces helicus]|uniref:Kinase-like domain-containing protein n=1 Tax=Blyttiomyces helicus TaxID=388810 RepID=A0A4P9W7R1_9FUNG|nr:kinase-like domain-containing protein [Blyttiomyces helicus]|eukprot:RKO88132.1 kinase-like domain-containing protein [Blyttiomyces helicus]